ncbi:hypothetical protein PUNSTDRAFT_97905 [Punctularia strigosozonata HHB-11173 SS5]|uniref:uncharacterized protein n=1 Tax=Punctularia strigosozonata (strain HHB-11173) TaxID=741275 RepID=UPI0004417699|nr:uncharacterized protein PUNSTDRAFT_97905 [Punctularia strigosozonata HHB-11173 SS5]EIN12929.1 hypothetical protein PUNSTDRAFT_97905 [Punctularia strigosozonata HHB-11173 SS5]
MSDSPCVSFIGIVDFTQEARWIFCSESVYDLLGYEPRELIGRPSLELVHPDEFRDVKQIHYDTISQDKAAVLLYTRMRHKDPYKGYILCAVSRTVAHDVLVGSVSFATPGPKAMHTASTAQEITVIAPTAKNFQFRRWNDPDPMPNLPHPTTVDYTPGSRYSSPDTDSEDEDASESDRSDRSASDAEEMTYRRASQTPPSEVSSPTGSDASAPKSRSRKPKNKGRGSHKEKGVISFDPLPSQSVRTALILDRFSTRCPIMYCSNDFLLQTTLCMGRSIYDFVAKKDEDLVRSWVDAVKGWGVNERGQPSDGGFGFGRFRCCRKGRDSSAAAPDASPTRRERHRQHSVSHPHAYPSPSNSSRNNRDRRKDKDGERDRNGRRFREREDDDEFLVDAIFSAHSDGLMVILRRAR